MRGHVLLGFGLLLLVGTCYADSRVYGSMISAVGTYATTGLLTVSDASVFRAVLTYTPPTLINYTTPIELSLFMADPNGNALALVDYMGASPTAITANDLASLAAGQKYTFFVIATGQTVYCTNGSVAFPTTPSASGVFAGAGCSLTPPSVSGVINTPWTTPDASFVISLSGAGNATNTPPYLQWVNQAGPTNVYVRSNATYTSPPFYVRDNEDESFVGLVSIAAVYSPASLLNSTATTWVRIDYNEATKLSMYVLEIVALPAVSGSANVELVMTDVLSNSSVNFTVYVNPPSIYTTNSSLINVVHGQQGTYYMNVTSALSYTLYVEGNVSAVFESFSLPHTADPNAYVLSFTAKDVPTYASTDIQFVAVTAAGNGTLNVTVQVTNAPVHIDNPGDNIFTVQLGQAVSSPVFTVVDPDDPISIYNISIDSSQPLEGLTLVLVDNQNPNNVSYKITFVASVNGSVNILTHASKPSYPSALMALSYDIVVPFAISLSSPGPFCALETVGFAISGADPSGVAFSVVSSNETVVPSTGFLVQMVAGSTGALSVRPTFITSYGSTNVTIFATDPTNLSANVSFRMEVLAVDCHAGSRLAGSCACNCSGVACSGAFNSTTCKCSCDGVTCPAGFKMDATSCACVNLCPADLPIKCSDLTCVANAVACVSASQLEQACNYSLSPGPLKCADSSCASGCAACMSALQPCPAYQCCNGNCVTKFSDCAIVPACDVLNLRCLNGSCVSDLSQCTADQLLSSTCGNSFGGQGVVCTDGVCRNGSAPDVEGNVCPLFNGCPAHTFLCADGRCVADMSSCLCSGGLLRCTNGDCVSSSVGCPQVASAIMPKAISFTFVNSSRQVTVELVSDDSSNAQLGRLVIPANTFPESSSLVIKPVADSYLSAHLSSQQSLALLGSSLASITLEDENGTELAVNGLSDGVVLSLLLVGWSVGESTPTMVFLNLTSGHFESVEDAQDTFQVTNVSLSNATTAVAYFLEAKLTHFTDFGVLLPNADGKGSSTSDVWVIGVAVAVPIAVVVVVGVIVTALLVSYIRRRRSRNRGDGQVFFDDSREEDEAL